MADFEHFFKSIGLSLLSRLKAVAMDMNASFNRLFQKYCPKVPIVYDRYHMQAQFGRDVMGAVRLEEAQKHRQEAEALKEYTKKLIIQSSRRWPGKRAMKKGSFIPN